MRLIVCVFLLISAIKTTSAVITGEEIDLVATVVKLFADYHEKWLKQVKLTDTVKKHNK